MTDYLEKDADLLVLNQFTSRRLNTVEKKVMKFVLLVITLTTVFFISNSFIPIIIFFIIWIILYLFGYYVAKWDIF